MIKGKHAYVIAALASLVMPASAGDVAVQILVTRRLTKRSIATPVYNLRGVAPPSAAEAASSGEMDKTIVVLEGGNAPALPPMTVSIEQRDGRFEPGVVVIPVGSSVQFPNFDPIFHNVFSLSKTQPFDLGYYPKDQVRTVKFSRGGIVQVYCHLHAAMYAAIVVTSSPWFAKPSDEGEVLWRDIPPGRYRAVAWHKVAGVHQVSVDVPATGLVSIKIRVPIDTEPSM